MRWFLKYTVRGRMRQVDMSKMLARDSMLMKLLEVCANASFGCRIFCPHCRHPVYGYSLALPRMTLTSLELCTWKRPSTLVLTGCLPRRACHPDLQDHGGVQLLLPKAALGTGDQLRVSSAHRVFMNEYTSVVVSCKQACLGTRHPRTIAHQQH